MINEPERSFSGEVYRLDRAMNSVIYNTSLLHCNIDAHNASTSASDFKKRIQSRPEKNRYALFIFSISMYLYKYVRRQAKACGYGIDGKGSKRNAVLICRSGFQGKDQQGGSNCSQLPTTMSIKAPTHQLQGVVGIWIGKASWHPKFGGLIDFLSVDIYVRCGGDLWVLFKIIFGWCGSALIRCVCLYISWIIVNL